jgi:hypothetical protein
MALSWCLFFPTMKLSKLQLYICPIVKRLGTAGLVCSILSFQLEMILMLDWCFSITKKINLKENCDVRTTKIDGNKLLDRISDDP